MGVLLGDGDASLGFPFGPEDLLDDAELFALLGQDVEGPAAGPAAAGNGAFSGHERSASASAAPASRPAQPMLIAQATTPGPSLQSGPAASAGARRPTVTTTGAAQQAWSMLQACAQAAGSSPQLPPLAAALTGPASFARTSAGASQPTSVSRDSAESSDTDDDDSPKDAIYLSAFKGNKRKAPEVRIGKGASLYAVVPFRCRCTDSSSSPAAVPVCCVRSSVQVDWRSIEDPAERRRQRRLAKNRATAARSRERKKEAWGQLEEVGQQALEQRRGCRVAAWGGAAVHML